MSDRIDTDAARGHVEQLRGCADADLGSHDVRWCLAVMDRLLDEVDALRSREARLTEEAVGVVEVVKFRHAEYGASPDFVQTAVLLAIIDRLVPVEEL